MQKKGYGLLVVYWRKEAVTAKGGVVLKGGLAMGNLEGDCEFKDWRPRQPTEGGRTSRKVAVGESIRRGGSLRGGWQKVAKVEPTLESSPQEKNIAKGGGATNVR